MGLFGKLGLGGRGGGRGSTQNKFMKVLDMKDLNTGTLETTLTVAGTWYKVGAGYTIPAQQMLHLGYGTPDLPDNQGYLYIHFDEKGGTPVTLHGKVRLVQSNAQQTVKYVVAEYNLASTHGSVTNKAMMIALPEQTQFPMVGEDSLVWLEVAAATATDIVNDEVSEVYIPVTIYM